MKYVVDYDDKKHKYTCNGKEIQSVTTVLSMLNKPLLLPWGVKITAAAFKSLLMERCSFDTSDANRDLYFDSEILDEVERLSKKAYRAKSTEAMATGTAVHDAIEQFVHGNIYVDQIPEGPVRNGLQAFMDYGDSVELDIHSQEEVVCWAEDGAEYPLYAGKYDMLARINGVLTMCDFKVAKDVYDEYWTQLMAYVTAVQPSLDEPIKQIAILRIDKETGTLHPEVKPVDTRRRDIFILLAKARQLMKEVEKNGNN